MIETVCSPVRFFKILNMKLHHCNSKDVRLRKTEEEIIQMLCVHQGFYCLRDLSNFDIGQSFANDSLHNVYHGVFVSLAVLYCLILRFRILATCIIASL